MKQEKQKIIDFAKDLYLQYDANGNKVYSLRDNSTKIQQKFNKKINYSTIKNWAEKYKWNATLEKTKQYGIEKATQENLTKEEQLIESKSNELAKNFKNAKTLSDIGYTIIFDAYKSKKEHPLISIKDALTAIKMGTDIQFRLMEIPENLDLKIKTEIPMIEFIKNADSQD